jgi:hypothetical protein
MLQQINTTYNIILKAHEKLLGAREQCHGKKFRGDELLLEHPPTGDLMLGLFAFFLLILPKRLRFQLPLARLTSL